MSSKKARTVSGPLNWEIVEVPALSRADHRSSMTVIFANDRSQSWHGFCAINVETVEANSSSKSDISGWEELPPLEDLIAVRRGIGESVSG